MRPPERGSGESVAMDIPFCSLPMTLGRLLVRPGVLGRAGEMGRLSEGVVSCTIYKKYTLSCVSRDHKIAGFLGIAESRKRVSQSERRSRNSHVTSMRTGTPLGSNSNCKVYTLALESARTPTAHDNRFELRKNVIVLIAS